MTPNDNQNDLMYLQELVILMIKADSRRGAVDSKAITLNGLLRKVPTLNVQTTSASALQLRKQMEEKVRKDATQVDDPWLIFLTREYVGKICFLHDVDNAG